MLIELADDKKEKVFKTINDAMVAINEADDPLFQKLSDILDAMMDAFNTPAAIGVALSTIEAHVRRDPSGEGVENYDHKGNIGIRIYRLYDRGIKTRLDSALIALAAELDTAQDAGAE